MLSHVFFVSCINEDIMAQRCPDEKGTALEIESHHFASLALTEVHPARDEEKEKQEHVEADEPVTQLPACQERGFDKGVLEEEEDERQVQKDLGRLDLRISQGFEPAEER
jgi:hypothetical protein